MSASETPRRGFRTLDALHAGVALLAVVLLAGVPSAGATDAERLLLARRHVVRGLSLTRELARQTGRSHGLAFDLEGDRLAIVDEAGEIVDHATRHEPLMAEIGADIMSADFGAGHEIVVVGGDGWPVAGGRVVLRSGLEEMSVELDAVTGVFTAGDDAAR